MVTVHFKLFNDEIFIGHFTTIEMAMCETAQGFSRCHFKTQSHNKMTLIADPVVVDVFDKFEDFLLDLGEDANIEKAALTFVRSKISPNNPIATTCWARALIMGLMAREIELTITGDISEEKLDVALAHNRLAA